MASSCECIVAGSVRESEVLESIGERESNISSPSVIVSFVVDTLEMKELESVAERGEGDAKNMATNSECERESNVISPPVVVSFDADTLEMKELESVTSKGEGDLKNVATNCECVVSGDFCESELPDAQMQGLKGITGVGEGNCDVNPECIMSGDVCESKLTNTIDKLASNGDNPAFPDIDTQEIKQMESVVNAGEGNVPEAPSVNEIDSSKEFKQPKLSKKQTSAKATTIYAKFGEEIDTFTNAFRYLENRLPPGLGITALEECSEQDTKRNIVAIHCKSRRVAKHVAGELHKGNAQSQTKIRCFDTIQDARGQKVRSHEEVEASYNYNLEQITSRADAVLKQHSDKIAAVDNQLRNIEGRKNTKVFSEYVEYENSKLALQDKAKELELQKVEFESYLEKCVNELERIKESPNFESRATNIRFNLAIECSRLSNALPIYARRSHILETVRNNQVCIIIGETGSGKSTQMAQYFYQAGLGGSGMIVCTQPRKIAASSLGIHVAKELGSCVGQVVGYKVGMQIRKTSHTRIMYMTDYVLLNECMKDGKLSDYSCIIIDEAHERSIHSDLLLGMIKSCLRDRPDLRVVITSATISPEVFVRYFDQCPVLKVSGRMFPVEVEWEEPVKGVDSFENYPERALRKALEVHQSEDEGDILVFLTKPQETEWCCTSFQDMMEGKDVDFVTLQLHGRLQAEEQQRVFEPPPPGRRKIVFATNSAETSVTIPGVRYVIDTGLVNEMKYDAVRKMSTLSVTMVTQSAARQRMGRAGRLGPGKCYRLYTEADYDRMSADATPEILKVHLGHAMLKLLELGVDPMEFEFIEMPSVAAMEEAFTSLVDIGAVADRKITEAGKWIAKMPYDPQYGVFVYEAVQAGLGVEAVVVAAASGTGPVFYRCGTDVEKELADRHKIPFCHEEGDQLTTLNVFKEWHQVGEREKGRWCINHYINGKILKSIREATNEVLNTLRKELKVDVKFAFSDKEKVGGTLSHLLFKALNRNLAYYLGSVKAGYVVVSKDQHVNIHPSSALWSLGSQPQWIVFDKVMRTTRNFAIQVAPVPESLLEAGIEEGWLHLQIEEAKKRVSVVCQENVGAQMFREFVGPRFVDFRKFESELITTCPNSIVVAEADWEKGQLRVLSSSSNKAFLSNSFSEKICPLRAKYESEESEERIGSAIDRPVRAILGAGGSTLRILMPGEYNVVMINCSLALIEHLSEEDMVKEFSKYGEIKQCVKFYRKNKYSKLWGKVVYENQEAAIAAVEATRETPDLTAHPNTRVTTCQTFTGNFNFKIQWCRRPSRCFGFVYFVNVEDYVKAAKLSYISIGGCIAKVQAATNSSQSVHVAGFNSLANEDLLREEFATKLKIHPMKDIDQVIVVREKVTLNYVALDVYKGVLQRKIGEFSEENNFYLDVKEPRSDRDINYLAYCSFRYPEEGYAACEALNQKFVLGDQVVSMKADIHSSILIHRDVFRLHREEIEAQLEEIENNNITIRRKDLQNGNIALNLHTESSNALIQARSNLQEVMKGEVLQYEGRPETLTLFSREGRRMLQDIMNKTQTLIITDDRVMTVSIYGLHSLRLEAKALIEEHVQQLALGNFSDVELARGGWPAGVMKALMIKYQTDFSGLVTEADLWDVKLNYRRHRVRLFGSQEAITKATALIMEVVESLSADASLSQEVTNPDCVACFCPIETKDLYRLEFCGHAYCRECVHLQVNSAINNKEFPIVCADENCSAKFVWKDFVNFIRLGQITSAQLVNASVEAYVGKHRNEVRYCLAPDCLAVYRITKTGEPFICPECEIRVCTTCHVQYHDGLTCEMIKRYSTGEGVGEWMSQDTSTRRDCPSCGTHIEKEGGCNNIQCGNCKKSICWTCMKVFDAEKECYGHMNTAHGSFY